MAPPRFLFFDLGKVLLRFDVDVMCRQIGDVSGIAAATVYDVLMKHPLQKDYECGRTTTRQFYEGFCRATGTRPDFEALLHAASDIFEFNASMIPVVAHLYRAGFRMGILSNTCESHWEHCLRRFSILGELFEAHALSYKIHAAKPQPAIFEAAARLAGVAPQEIFFTDDLPGHVAGARAVGFDAVQYISTPQLVADLRARGVRFNY
jgi:putative hydrolase of the HAD superfamily